MNIFKQKELYTNSILTFLVIVLIDWFMGAGFNLFKGYTFSQTRVFIKLCQVKI